MEKSNLLKKRGSDQPIAQNSVAKKSSLNADQLQQSLSDVCQKKFLQSSPIPVPEPKFNVHEGYPAMSSQQFLRYQQIRREYNERIQSRRHREKKERSNTDTRKLLNRNCYGMEEYLEYDRKETEQSKYKQLQYVGQVQQLPDQEEEEEEQSSFGQEQQKTNLPAHNILQQKHQRETQQSKYQEKQEKQHLQYVGQVQQLPNQEEEEQLQQDLWLIASLSEEHQKTSLPAHNNLQQEHQQETQQSIYQEQQGKQQLQYVGQVQQLSNQEEEEQLQQDLWLIARLSEEQQKRNLPAQQDEISLEQIIQIPCQDMQLTETERAQAPPSGLLQLQKNEQEGQSFRNHQNHELPQEIFASPPKNDPIEKKDHIENLDRLEKWLRCRKPGCESENNQSSQSEEEETTNEGIQNLNGMKKWLCSRRPVRLERISESENNQSSESEQESSNDNEIEEFKEFKKWRRSRKLVTFKGINKKFKPTLRVLPIRQSVEFSDEDEYWERIGTVDIGYRNSRNVPIDLLRAFENNQISLLPHALRNSSEGEEDELIEVEDHQQNSESEENERFHNRSTQTSPENFPNPPTLEETEREQLLKEISELKASLRDSKNYIRSMRRGETRSNMSIERLQQKNSNESAPKSQTKNSELVSVPIDRGSLSSSSKKSNPQQRNIVSAELGPNGTNIPLSEYRKIFCDSATGQSATKQLLTLLFDQQTLAAFSLLPSDGRGPTEGKLDPKVLEDIVSAVSLKCDATEKEINSAIVEECIKAYKSINLVRVEALYAKFRRLHNK